MASEPSKVLALGLEKLRILFGNYEYPQLYNYYAYRQLAPVLVVLPTASFIIGPALVGLAMMWIGQHGRSRRLLTLLILVYGLVFVPFFVVGRFRSAWILLLTPFAAWTLVNIVRAARAKRLRRASLMAGATLIVGLLSAAPLPAHPTMALQHLEFVRASLAKGNDAEAVRWAWRATKQAPTVPATWAALAEALTRSGQPQRALAVLRQGIEIHPTAPALLQQLAVVYVAAGRTREAIELLHRSIAQQPGASEGWVQLGLAFEYCRCFKEAIEAFRSATTLGLDAERTAEIRQRITELEKERVRSDQSDCPCHGPRR